MWKLCHLSLRGEYVKPEQISNFLGLPEGRNFVLDSEAETFLTTGAILGEIYGIM